MAPDLRGPSVSEVSGFYVRRRTLSITSFFLVHLQFSGGGEGVLDMLIYLGAKRISLSGLYP